MKMIKRFTLLAMLALLAMLPAGATTITAVNVGTTPNDGTGDTLRAAMVKLNANDSNLNADKIEDVNGSATGLTLSGTTAIGGTLNVSATTTISGGLTTTGTSTIAGFDNADEIAQGLTRGEPSLFFNGINEYVSIPQNDAFSFTDGTNDLPASFFAWVKADDLTNFSVGGVFDASDNADQEWELRFDGSDKLRVRLEDGSGSNSTRIADAATTLEGEWIHVGFTFDASSSGTATADGVTLYINAAPVDSSTSNSGSFNGLHNGGGDLWIGHTDDKYAEGEIREVQLYNTALTAAQVEQVYRSGVPYELSQAQAGESVTDGGFENWDSATDLTNWAEGSGGSSTVNRESTVVDSGTYAVRFDLDSSANYAAVSQNSLTVGKQYRATIRARGDGSSVGLQFGNATDGAAYHNTGLVFTTSYTTYSFTFIATEVGFAIGRQAGSASSSSIYIDNVSVREAGAILDIRAADATMSGSNINLPDRSSNGFSGTSSNMSLAANAVNLPAAVSTYHPNPASGEALLTLGNGGSGSDFAITEDWSGTWSPTLSFGGSSTGITYSVQEGHYRKLGDVVTASFLITLSNKGSSTSTARITGLPYGVLNTTNGNMQGASIGWTQNMASLNGPVTGLAEDNSTSILLYDSNASGAVGIDDSNFTNTSSIRGTITYLTN